ncbi:Lipopolysaccharide heptosyltransferase 1 [Candidatus Providencia siddallii]|uniref:Lipopolysaccharide heptosyltransferase 1 n=1 Tax=Candidatus Providencia siddallii TaxID=1715285 RepID=A0A0M6W812_9GAMM|nr:Lipopolysaccharide heptosyltransferase 1 [Candidatus Providencia siddallii]
MKILLIKTSSIGDILHSFPALTDAKQVIPNIKFDWVIEENFSQIPFWHKAVNRIITTGIRRWRKNWFSKQTKIERTLFIQKLQSENYNAIIDAQGLFKSAFFITRLARGCKHGYNYYSIRERFASFFYDQKYFISKQQHAIERIRQLFAKSIGYQYQPTKAQYDINHIFFQSVTKNIYPYIIFLHSTTRTNKHWPEFRWKELISKIIKIKIKIKLPWVTNSEQQRALRLANNFNFIEVLPKLTLTEIGKEIINAKAIVSVDTGLSHLASALNKPNITLYGPTKPDLIGRYGEKQYFIKSTNNKMINIKSDDVYQQLIKYI